MENNKILPRLLAIYRAPCFSPNAVEKDKAILDAVCERFSGWEIVRVKEENILQDAEFQCCQSSFDAVVSMARSAAVLDFLQRFQTKIHNTPESIRNCNRRNIEQTMFRIGLDTPASLVEKHSETKAVGWWVKKVDTTDSSPNHVYLSENKLEETSDTLVQPNIKGECVKFYGVGDKFFFIRSETSAAEAIKCSAFKLAKALGLTIYGGDAMVTGQGDFAIIDFNDFPSFSACREEAAEAIRNLFEARIGN